ncbi:MAG: flagellar motor protein MotB [Terriglobales bacterium]
MNRRSRRRSEDHPKVNHERWLISYADFITLLFAFFVVLYTASQSDHAKARAYAVAIQQAFVQLGLFNPASPQLHLEASPAVAAAAVEARDLHASSPLAHLRDELGKELAPEIGKHEISLNLNRQGLVIRLEELGFFPSGSDQLRPDAAPVVARIAHAIAPLPNPVRIEGHTDDVPIHTARFASNWQLSTARATELVRRFISDDHFAPERLSAAGYAEFHPIASNRTAEGRQLNRRVDVVVVSAAAAAAETAAGPSPPRKLP